MIGAYPIGTELIGGGALYTEFCVKKIYVGTNPVPIQTLKLGNIDIKEVWVGAVKVFSLT